MSGLWNDISYGFRHLAETYSHGYHSPKRRLKFEIHIRALTDLSL